jgi:adenylate kinase family enzyme
MRRVSVVGNSGSGKTTLARDLAARLAVDHVELDAIFHQPGWKELSADAFRAAVGERVRSEAWVMCGNYSAVRDLVWARADTVVWLDFPRHVVMRRVIGRTLRRAVTRAELWNGNREPFANLWRWDPERSIIRWAWTRHSSYRVRYTTAMADPRWAALRFVRLDGAGAAQAFLAGVTPVAGVGTGDDAPG